VNNAEQQSAEDESNRIRDSNALYDHRNYGRGNQQPYEDSTDEFAVISGSLNALQNQPSRSVAKEKAAAQKRL
jgi:hypothetical protein